MGKTDYLQGALDLLILQTLALGPNHGWGIQQRITQISREALTVSQGSLYPALHRLERAGLLASRWSEAQGRRRRVYQLTPKGRKALADRHGEWRDFARAAFELKRGMQRVIDFFDKHDKRPDIAIGQSGTRVVLFELFN